MNHIQSFTSALLAGVIMHGLTGCTPAADLPFDGSHPLIYDNDTELEGLDLPYAAALASTGEIRLVAVTYLIAHDYPAFMSMARRSGLAHLPEIPSLAENRVPDVINSETTGLVLSRPASGLIEDTVPVINASVHTIIQQARLATPEKPLVIATGGPVTNVASAYLLEPDIADRVIVSSILSAGANGWNDTADPWAKYVVLERLRSVIFSPELRNTNKRKPQLSVARLQESMPDVELRRYMMDRAAVGNDKAIDIASLMVVTHPELVLQTRQYAFSHWAAGEQWWPDAYHLIPVYMEDDNGAVTVITQIAPRSEFTGEYWRAISNPSAYHPQLISQQTPFTGSAHVIPGTIEAEQFDFGGETYAYHDATIPDFTAAQRHARFRTLDRIEMEAVAGSDNDLFITGTSSGEWFEYSVNITASGNYTPQVRIATGGEGGHIRLAFDDNKIDTVINIPDTGGAQQWQTVTAADRVLTAGKQVLRVTIETGGVNLNWIRFTAAKAEDRQ
jgi:hypothetical protein